MANTKTKTKCEDCGEVVMVESGLTRCPECGGRLQSVGDGKAYL